MDLEEGYVVLKVSGILFFGSVKILPQRKYSKIVSVVKYLETENFVISNKHDIIVTVKPFLS